MASRSAWALPALAGFWLAWSWAGPAPAGAAPFGWTTAPDSSRSRPWRLAFGTGLEAARERTEWLSRRRQFSYRGLPYGLTTLPLLYYSSYSGWNYGARLNLSQYTRRPFAYRVSGGAVHYGTGRVDAFARVRIPSLRGSPWGLEVLADVSEGRRSYFGQGNDARTDHGLTDPASPRYRDESYYHFRIKKPRVFVVLERAVRRPFVVSAGFGLKHVTIHHAEGASLLFEEQPPGLDGGTIALLGGMVRWDTRDDEGIPRRGVLHEWSYETSHNSVTGLLVPTIGYSRYTITDQRYRPVTNRVFLANRMVFEAMEGRVPIDVYGDLGGLRRKVRGLGGDETLRGYVPNRFIDDVRFYSNTEVRCRLHVYRVLRQYLEWLGVVFVDTGRVWPELSAVRPRGLHATAGGGLRVYWNEEFVLSLEYQRSAEGTVLGTRLGNIF
ncbi:MAG: BamA/TamA family outer membrane protein [Gemmatimonadota bacterium]